MAQEVCAAINRGSGRAVIRVDDKTGLLSLEDVLLVGLRPILERRRMVLVICIASPITDVVPVVNISVRGADDMLRSHPEADPVFGRTVERVLSKFDNGNALPCIVTSLRPLHTGIFLQRLPWSACAVCECCGARECASDRC
eukprot:5862520-Prymnesium_polylepis.1